MRQVPHEPPTNRVGPRLKVDVLGLLREISPKKKSVDKVAAVLNYVLTTFNAKLLPSTFTPYTAAEVKKYRSGDLSTGEVHKQRKALLKMLSAHQGGR